MLCPSWMRLLPASDWSFVELNKDAVRADAMEHDEMRGKRTEVERELEETRVRMRAEREKLKAEMERRREALMEAKRRTGMDK
eukprot:5297584-Pyramimonas_sp.AAC.1